MQLFGWCALFFGSFLFDFFFFFCSMCVFIFLLVRVRWGGFVSSRSSKRWPRRMAALVPPGCSVGFMNFVGCALLFVAVHGRRAILFFGVQHGSGGGGGSVTTCMRLAQGIGSGHFRGTFGTCSGRHDHDMLRELRTFSGHVRGRVVAGHF